MGTGERILSHINVVQHLGADLNLMDVDIEGIEMPTAVLNVYQLEMRTLLQHLMHTLMTWKALLLSLGKANCYGSSIERI